MAAVVIDGNAIAEQHRQSIADELQVLRLSEVRPGLATVLIGANDSSIDIDPERMRKRLLEQPLELAPGPMRLRRVENRPRRKRRPREQGDQQSSAA